MCECVESTGLAGEECMLYETTNWIAAYLQRMLLHGRPDNRPSLPKALSPALTQSVCLCVLCACLCVHHMPAHVCTCMYLTQRMEHRISGMLENWATSTSAFSVVTLLTLLRQAFTVLPRLASNFDPPAQPPQKLELQMCTTMPGLPGFLN